jgi:hypothetical protein
MDFTSTQMGLSGTQMEMQVQKITATCWAIWQLGNMLLWCRDRCNADSSNASFL